MDEPGVSYANRFAVDSRLMQHRHAVLEQLCRHGDPEIAEMANELISGRTTARYIMTQRLYNDVLGSGLDRAAQYYHSLSDEETESLEQNQDEHLDRLIATPLRESAEAPGRRRASCGQSNDQDEEDFSDINWLGR